MKRMQQVFPLAFLFLFALTGFSSMATAKKKKLKVHIKNCSSQRIRICVFNGKDSSTVASIGLKMHSLNAGGIQTFRCHGQGAGKCNFRIGYYTSTSQCSSNFMKTTSAKRNKWLSVLKDGKSPRVKFKKGSSSNCN